MKSKPSNYAVIEPQEHVRLIACRHCDCLHEKVQLELNSIAKCTRCHSELYTRKPFTIDRSLAATLACLVLFLISLFLPFLSLTRSGLSSSISVLDAISVLWLSDMRWLGLLSMALIVLLPLVRLLLLLWVLWRLRLHLAVIPNMRIAMRWVDQLEPWAMAEVFMIGVVVALVKVSSLANLDVGPAFWALLGVIALSVVTEVVLCRDTVWQLLTTPSA